MVIASTDAAVAGATVNISNSINAYDRSTTTDADYTSRQSASCIRIQYTRSWFQTPNSYDTQFGYV